MDAGATDTAVWLYPKLYSLLALKQKDCECHMIIDNLPQVLRGFPSKYNMPVLLHSSVDTVVKEICKNAEE